MKWKKEAAAVSAAVLAAACGHVPPVPSDQHLNPEPPALVGAIPPPVQLAPLLPAPKPTVRPETYSVVVNNVRLQELLFALARDARINVDIHPEVNGTVTLNAIDQTLPQLLQRIARQVDMRYEFHGDTLFIMRDTPFLRTYKIDYLSATRNVRMQSTASTQFGAGGAAGAAPGTSTTGATAQIDVAAENKLWESIVQNLRDILGETTVASVIGNRESGILYVRANSKQHERVQEFLDQVMTGARRQVLIEATVAEVQLRNEYQRGIEWQRLRNPGQSGLSFSQPPISPPASFNPNPFLVGFFSAGNNFSASVKLLEQFGDVRVLSSPKLTVLNNQTAILRVTRDIIYFTITPSTQPITIAGGAGATVQASFTTTPNVAAEGFMMSVLPYINDANAIVLNVKPTIRRRVDSAIDPNPALVGGTPNAIPVFETREFDSMLRLHSGETAVLAGLMQDATDQRDAGIPGLRSIPIIGEVLSQRSELTTKTELVIFLRATVIRDPSLEGDFRGFREQLPREDFFVKPNPQRAAPPLGPDRAPLQ